MQNCVIFLLLSHHHQNQNNRNQSCFNQILNPNKSLFSRQNLGINRNFRKKVDHKEPIKDTNRNINTSPFDQFAEPQFIKNDTLMKTLIFSLSFSVGSFVGVTIVEYERIRAKAAKALKGSNSIPFFKRFQKNPSYNNPNPGNELSAEIVRILGFFQTKLLKLFFYLKFPEQIEE
jgi:hypothetical protein